jgi:hypothetical protein
MTLGSTQPLTEMSTRNLLGGEGRPVRKTDKLTATYEPIVYKMRDPRRQTTLWTSTACYRVSFTFYLTLSRNNNRKHNSFVECGEFYKIQIILMMKIVRILTGTAIFIMVHAVVSSRIHTPVTTLRVLSPTLQTNVHLELIKY